MATILVTSGDDTLFGVASENDSMVGFEGNHVLIGEA
jgi:hypothetical protein